jgi:hypothetical protein
MDELLKIIDLAKEEDFEEFVSRWTRFKNWLIVSCDFHHDYSIDEMLGVLKFIIPIITFDDSIEKINNHFKINCGQQLNDIKFYLLRRKYEKLLEAGPYSEIDYNNSTEFYRDELRKIKNTISKNKEQK